MKSCFDSHAVIGLGFGDEGKGALTSVLAQSLPNPLVIRYSGGQQAGHTVMTKEDGKLKFHIFANFGSGTLHGAPTYWSRFCSFDPVGVINEYDILVEKGHRPTLFVSKDTPITTPYDKYWNQQVDSKNGTCGVGVGPTFEREASYYSLLVGDLLFPSVFRTKLGLIEKIYYDKDYGDQEEFLAACLKVSHCPDIHFVDGVPPSGSYIFEGSQGLMLDQNIGFFPHVTRSNVGSKNILEMGFTPYCHLVTRAFQTRHGAGPMTNEGIPHGIQENPWETNVKNQYQGEFRQTVLDLDLLKYGIERDVYLRTTPHKDLTITCTDLIEGDFKYTIDGGEVISHSSKEAFARGVADYLGIDNVVTTDSPITKGFAAEEVATV